MADHGRVTYPIENSIGRTEEGVLLLDTYCQWYAGQKSPAVQRHKHHLGRQAYCITLSRRFWVWEFPTYRVLVNNTKGVCIEMNAQDGDALGTLRHYMALWD